MASIGAVTLAIEASPTSLHAVARFNLNFTPDEVNMNLAHRLVCQLVGDDDGFLNQLDDPIRDGVMTDQVLRPNGRATRRFDLVLNLMSQRVHEDVVATDEIRALVTLTPQLTGSTPIVRLSNRIELDVSELLSSRS